MRHQYSQKCQELKSVTVRMVLRATHSRMKYHYLRCSLPPYNRLPVKRASILRWAATQVLPEATYLPKHRQPHNSKEMGRLRWGSMLVYMSNACALIVILNNYVQSVMSTASEEYSTLDPSTQYYRLLEQVNEHHNNVIDWRSQLTHEPPQVYKQECAIHTNMVIPLVHRWVYWLTGWPYNSIHWSLTYLWLYLV